MFKGKIIKSTDLDGLIISFPVTCGSGVRVKNGRGGGGGGVLILISHIQKVKPLQGKTWLTG